MACGAHGDIEVRESGRCILFCGVKAREVNCGLVVEQELPFVAVQRRLYAGGGKGDRDRDVLLWIIADGIEVRRGGREGAGAGTAAADLDHSERGVERQRFFVSHPGLGLVNESADRDRVGDQVAIGEPGRCAADCCREFGNDLIDCGGRGLERLAVENDLDRLVGDERGEGELDALERLNGARHGDRSEG